MRKKRLCALSFMALVSLILSGFPVTAETPSAKPRIVVFGFLNLTGDSSFSIPTETATENLSFSLKLLNRYETVETEMILRDINDARLARYCASQGLDFILYGTLTQKNDGTQLYELSLFDRQKGSTTVRESETGESVMDVFDIADRLSASVLGSIVGRRLSFGSIRPANTGKPADFDVFIDGIQVGSGEATIDHVPDGPHMIRLVRTGAIPPDTPATLDFTVTVSESTIATVSFEFEQFAEQDTLPPAETAPTEPVPELAPVESALEEIPVGAGDAKQPVRSKVFFEPYGLAEKALGDYGELVDLLASGGVSAGYAASRFGFALRAQAATAIIPPDKTSSYFSIAAFAGAFYRFTFADGAFEIRPEIDGGVWRHSIAFTDDSSVTGFDPAIQPSIACIAYVGPVGFELAPFATILPESDATLLAPGIRFGISFGGRR